MNSRGRALRAPEHQAPVIKDGTRRKGRRWLQALPPLPQPLRQFVQPSAEAHGSLEAAWGSPQGLTGKPLLHDKDKPSANLGRPHHPFPKKQVFKVGQGHWGQSQRLGSLPAATCHVHCQPPAPQAPHRGICGQLRERPLSAEPLATTRSHFPFLCSPPPASFPHSCPLPSAFWVGLASREGPQPWGPALAPGLWRQV